MILYVTEKKAYVVIDDIAEVIKLRATARWELSQGLGVVSFTFLALGVQLSDICQKRKKVLHPEGDGKWLFKEPEASQGHFGC